MADIINIGTPRDPNVPGAGTTELPPVFENGGGLAGIKAVDIDAFFNMRGWLQAACEAKGARMVGGGIGCGQADIDIEFEGHRYNISIRPLRR